MRQLDVDVVIVAYRPGRELRGAIDSVTSETGVACGITIVDNSPANPVSAQAAALAGARYLRMAANVGFCSAVNAGLGSGSAPYVLLLNQDAVLSGSYLTALLGRLEGDPHLGSAGGRLLRQEVSAAFIDSTGIAILRGRRPIDLRHGDPDDGVREGVDEVFGVTAAAALYRRTALEAVAVRGAVLPDEYFMYLDDVDLAWRLRLAGYRALVDHAAIAWHGRSAAGDANGEAHGLRRVVRTMRVERDRPDYVRECSYVNLILTLVRNDDPGPFLDQLPYMAARRLPGDAFGVVQRPAMALRARARLAALLPGALAARREIQARRVVSAADMAQWLP